MTRSHLLAGLLLIVSIMASAFNRPSAVGELNMASASVNLSARQLYESMNLDAEGLSEEAMEYAVAGYNKLVNAGKVTNTRYLTIVDFTRRLDEKRFYLLDLENEEVVLSTYVMHGKNSGKEKAIRFSNRINSYQSSLGFYLTGNTYKGRRGYSLRLQGLEKNFNSNALARAIVLHGSEYISEKRAQSGKLGRSEGCPAIPKKLAPEVIDMVKGGSVLFIYHPTEEYLQESPVLNSIDLLGRTD